MSSVEVLFILLGAFCITVAILLGLGALMGGMNDDERGP